MYFDSFISYLLTWSKWDKCFKKSCLCEENDNLRIKRRHLIFLYGNILIGNGYRTFFHLVRDCIMKRSNLLEKSCHVKTVLTLYIITFKKFFIRYLWRISIACPTIKSRIYGSWRAKVSEQFSKIFPSDH